MPTYNSPIEALGSRELRKRQAARTAAEDWEALDPATRRKIELRRELAREAEAARVASEESLPWWLQMFMGSGPGRAMFLGARALRRPVQEFQKAMDLLKRPGATLESVWKDTSIPGMRPGISFGKEGKPRFEISDRDMRLVNLQAPNQPPQAGAFHPLERVLLHPELSENYAGVAPFPRVRFDYAQRPSGTYDSTLARGRPTIEISGPSAVSWKRTLGHELQHWVQNVEGHGRGGSPEYVTNMFEQQIIAPLYRRTQGIIDQHAKRLLAQGIPEGSPQFDDAMSTFLRSPYMQKAIGNYERAFEAYNNPVDMRELYRRIAGEVEANLTKNRFNLGLAERSVVSPYHDASSRLMAPLREEFPRSMQMFRPNTLR